MMSPEEALGQLEELSRFYGGLAAREYWGDHVCLAAQPHEPNGSVEDVVARGVDATALVTAQWAELIVDAVSDLSSVSSIQTALANLHFHLDLHDFARIVEREILRGAMLGALDSEWEREHESDVAPATFAAEWFAEGAFSNLPFADALENFLKKRVLPPPAFAALEAGAKRKAFTVAGMASAEMLNVTKAELARQMAEGRGDGAGVDLKSFAKFAKERLESAGWTPANKSHLETIYRTNVVGAYSSGRYVEQRKPEVLAALPYWQARGVGDSRARPTHKRAHGVVLLATDPFWQRAYTPWGYNCRCRVTARSKRWFEASGLKLGPVPKDLPDPGFESRVMLPVPDHLLADPKAPPAAPQQPAHPPWLHPPTPPALEPPPAPPPLPIPVQSVPAVLQPSLPAAPPPPQYPPLPPALALPRISLPRVSNPRPGQRGSR